MSEVNQNDDLLGIEVPPAPQAVAAEPKAMKPKATRKKKDTVVASEYITQKTESTDDRIRIIIDEVKGMSNYETVGVNGRIYQIKRGEPVYVPKEVVNVLQDAVMTDTVIDKHPITGERIETVRSYSAIPWRRA